MDRLDQQTLNTWPFSFAVRTEYVWDGFVILGLLQDCLRFDLLLDVPHTGDQRDRFTAAMQERNTRIQQYGLGQTAHHCDRCTRFYDFTNEGRGVRESLCMPLS